MDDPNFPWELDDPPPEEIAEPARPNAPLTSPPSPSLHPPSNRPTENQSTSGSPTDSTPSREPEPEPEPERPNDPVTSPPSPSLHPPSSHPTGSQSTSVSPTDSTSSPPPGRGSGPPNIPKLLEHLETTILESLNKFNQTTNEATASYRESIQGRTQHFDREITSLLERHNAIGSSIEITAEQARDEVSRTLKKMGQLPEKLDKMIERNHRHCMESATAARDATQAALKIVTRETRGIRWKSLLTVSIVPILVAPLMLWLLTATSPGWTMSEDQRRWLQLGQMTEETYIRADPETQARIRRVMDWTDDN